LFAVKDKHFDTKFTNGFVSCLKQFKTLMINNEFIFRQINQNALIVPIMQQV